MTSRTSQRGGRDESVCPACDTIIKAGEPVSFQHGELLHLSCYEALTAAKKPTRPVAPPKRDDVRNDDRSAGSAQ
jgi:hypothetical protein